MGIGARITSEVPKTEERAESQQFDFKLSDLVLSEKTRDEVLDFLAYEKFENLVFEDWGLSQTHKHNRQRAINLYGSPGSGKTMAAYAIANELNRSLFAVNYAELESKYVGETSKNITSLFSEAKKCNGIILFDEADAMLSRRVSDMSSSTDVSVNQTRSVLLSLMNGHTGVIIFTTNFIENYDPAFMRRILFHINFELPDDAARELLWGKYIPEKLRSGIDVASLVSASAGLSGSEISSCVLKAAIQSARLSKSNVSQECLYDAICQAFKSKEANRAGYGAIEISRREVSEEYVRGKNININGFEGVVS